jgi:hypothetical protein
MSEEQTIQEQVEQAYAEACAKRDQLQEIELPEYITNKQFHFVRNKSGNCFNLDHIVAKDFLLEISGFVIAKEEQYNNALKVMEEKDSSIELPEFRWLGYTAQEWVSDVNTRIIRLDHVSKVAKLDCAILALEQMRSEEALKAEILINIKTEVLDKFE